MIAWLFRNWFWGVIFSFVYAGLVFTGAFNDFSTVLDYARLHNISEERAAHILHGDYNGGGHKYGTKKPCKSEFPEDWNEVKILTTVSKIAANDNLAWRQEHNGYHVTEKTVDNVRVRVVIDNKKDQVITAYPTNRRRNPCPANDN